MNINSRVKFNNEKSHRSYDANGFLTVTSNPILTTEPMEYLGSELVGDTPKIIDGVMVQPDKIYSIRIPEEELEKAKDTFTLLPVLYKHTWLSANNSEEGEDALNNQQGTTGGEAQVKDGKLLVDIKLTGRSVIKKILSGVKELSSSYTNLLKRDLSGVANFIAYELEANHLAVVEHGRAGSEVCIQNQQTVEGEKQMEKLLLTIGDRTIDLMKFFEEEKSEGHEAINQDEVSKEEAPAEEPKKEELEEKSENSEDKVEDKAEEKAEETKEEAKEVVEEKTEGEAPVETVSLEQQIKTILQEARIDEDKIGRILSVLADKDEEKAENECEVKAENSLDKIMSASKQAYKEVVSVIGDDFNAAGLTAEEIYSYALNKRGIKTENHSSSELKAMIESLKTVKVDNSFNPALNEADDSDYIEINL